MVEFLLDIQEIRRPESIYQLSANWWSSIKDLKDKIFSLTHEPPSRQHIYHSTNPVELHNNQILHDLGIEQSGRMLRVAIDYRTRQDFTLTPTKGVLIDDACKEMLRNVRLGLQRNRVPKITDEFEGSGGVYFLRSANGSYEAVFKPHDEEQGMPANPKDHVGAGKEGLREHFQPGQGCLRELAAYIMDYQNFCRVPATTLVHCEHSGFHYPASGRSKVKGSGDPYPKLGSLQRFIHGAELFEDVGQGLLSDLEVQKIALLDMRILNCDRNAANILVKYTRVQEYHGAATDEEDDDHITFLASSDDSDDAVKFSPHSSPLSERKSLAASTSDQGKTSVYELYPIDHGYAMPSHLKIFEWDWAWLYYPQVDRAVAPEIVNYMETLNIDELLQKLEPQVPLSNDSVFLLRLSHYLILHSIRAGLTLKDIAMTIARSDEDVPSKMEHAVLEAEENAYRSIELKSSSRIQLPNSTVSSLTGTSPKSSSTDSSPRSTVDVSPCKTSNKDEVPEFPVSISLDLLRGKDEELTAFGSRNCGSKSGSPGGCGSSNCRRPSGSSCGCGDDHTTNDSEGSSWSDRASPPASHAVNHSPMRPHLSSSASWNSFTSFHAPQPSLHSYVVKPPSRDTSLGMSPRARNVESKYLPPSKRVEATTRNPDSVKDQLEDIASVMPKKGGSVSVLSNDERRLDTIVEYARERGLSSLSNCSTASRDSEGDYQAESKPPYVSGQGSSLLSTIPSCEEFGVSPPSGVAMKGTGNKPSLCPPAGSPASNSIESLGGMHVELHTPATDDDAKHMSLPRNALRRMNAVNNPTDLAKAKATSGDGTTTPPPSIASAQERPGVWRPSRDVSKAEQINASDTETLDLPAVQVDLGHPLIRKQQSIDSSLLTPFLYGHGVDSWAPTKQARQKSPKLTLSALNAATGSRGSGGSMSSGMPQVGQIAKVMSSSSMSSSGGSGDEYAGDYGFFKSVKDAEFNNADGDNSPMNYGEFSGLELPSTDCDDNAVEDLCVPVPLTRVVSFSGFESAPVYNNIFSGAMGNLRLERRKAIAKTPEFQQLRLQFALEHMTAIIQRIKREKVILPLGVRR
mmetsp:Transcript_14950/g.24729  ORF Transcript_14950/g.24729 Transcript_14950/m.24729 type:complete len:1082 (+) Transcript_14950:101-3346(+)